MFRCNLLILWVFVALVISQAEPFNVYGKIGAREFLLGRKPIGEILAVSIGIGFLVALTLAWLLDKIRYVEVRWLVILAAFSVLVFLTADGNLYLREDGPGGEDQVYDRFPFIPVGLALIMGSVVGSVCFLCLLASWAIQRTWSQPGARVPV
jgi:hypothetical protein